MILLIYYPVLYSVDHVGVCGEVQLPFWFPVVVVKLIISMLQDNMLIMHGYNKHKSYK